MIRENFDPDAIARSYAAGGAACLSVLTEPTYFQGDDTHLRAARSATNLPILRKDFILDEYQVLEARAIGADCILLIMAALTDTMVRGLLAEAAALGLDCLVEVHTENELTRALALGARLIGINNRNLATLTTDLATTERLAPQVPPDCLLVGESGISGKEDVTRLMAAGVRCFLIGESLMRQPDPGLALQALLTSV
jgi:indole-3-glycerol phosphate synthase